MASLPPDLPAPSESTLARLLAQLRLSRSGALLIAVANDPLTRRAVTDRLLQDGQAYLAFAQFRFTDERLSLMDFIREGQPPQTVIVADGLSDLADEPRRKAILGLNRQRNVLGGSGCSIVLWVAEAHVPELTYHAGDFWAWHAAQYYFPDSDLEPWLVGRTLPGDDARLLSHYLAQVRAHHRYLPLPLARRGGPGTRADIELADVFVPLTLRDPQEEKKARGRASIPQPSRSTLSRQERPTGEGESEPEEIKPASFGEVFTRYPCFLLVGPPGSGKTTLLRRAALAFAEAQAGAILSWDGPALLPIFVRLRNFGAFLTAQREQFSHPAVSALTTFLDAYFHDEYGLALTPDFFERRLTEGRCLVLLDGLDEVTANRVEVARCVNTFIRQFASRINRFGLSSRPVAGYAAAAEHLREARPVVAEVNPLDANGIRQLIRRLVQLIESNPATRARDAADLPQRLLASPALTRLAGIPLFCTTLVLVYKFHGAQLPQRRVEVYQEVVDLLLGFWRAHQPELVGARDLAQEDGTGEKFADVSQAVSLKKRRLAHLALQMQIERLTDVSADWARAELARYLHERERKDPVIAEAWAESFLRNAHEHSGVFVASEEGAYAFAHQGFREYLAATALTNQRETQFLQTVLSHLDDDWWEQVILLAGAHPELPDGTRAYLIESLLAAAKEAREPIERHKRLLMAGQCAVDMAGLLPGQEREQIERALLHLMRDTRLEGGDYPRDVPNDPPTAPSSLLPQTRLEAGLLLDSLGWIPPDLYDFVHVSPLPHPQTGKGSGVRADFYIAKYPVTNLQYARFLEAPDYADETLWQSLVAIDLQGKPRPMGEQALEWFRSASEKGKRVPLYWDDARFGASHRLFPVVGVTWYEAAAYCAWLTLHWREREESSNSQFQTSNPQFRLPLEAEWQAAAGGVWAEKIDKEKPRYAWQTSPADVSSEDIVRYANTSESNLDRTSPVCMYPTGAGHPHKIMDMGGNVWEWQANFYGKDRDWLALRGGAWFNGMGFARVAVRDINHPDLVWAHDGFRVVGAAPVSR